LDSDTDDMMIDEEESDQVTQLLSAAESEDANLGNAAGVDAVADLEQSVEELIDVEQNDNLDQEDEQDEDEDEEDEEEEEEDEEDQIEQINDATGASGTLVATHTGAALTTPVLPLVPAAAGAIPKPTVLLEVDTAVIAESEAEVESSSEEIAQSLGGDADQFAAVAASHTSVDAVAEAESTATAVVEEGLTLADVSRIPVAVTLRRRGRKPRVVQLLMQHLKTVSDELPLYPMRGVGQLPPIFDANAGQIFDDPTPQSQGKPLPPLPAEAPRHNNPNF